MTNLFHRLRDWWQGRAFIERTYRSQKMLAAYLTELHHATHKVQPNDKEHRL